MRRGLTLTLASLLGLLLLVLLVVTVILGTTAGSRWALQQVPGLTLENFDGRLGGAWRADRLHWQQGDSRVEVLAPALDWSPSCLLRATLCIERLAAERIDLHFPPSTESSDEPLRLPDLDLPLALQVGDVQIGSLTLNDAEQLQTLHLQAKWVADGLRIERLQLQRDALSVDIQGTVQPRGDWPLSLTGDVTLPAPGETPWQLAVQVSGDLLHSLNLQADSQGYLNGRLTGEVQPLAEHLPAQVRLEADGFLASPDLPPTLRLDDLMLKADGNLQDGYAIDGAARLPAEEGPMALRLLGSVTAEGAQIEALDLTANPAQRVQLSGSLDWRESFSLDSRFDWQDFPWQRLYPLDEPPPVALRTLKGELVFADGNYLGNFAADLQGPAGDFSVSSPVSGDLQQVFLPELRVTAGQGQVAGQVSVGFADGVRWDANLAVSQFDPAYWVAELPGTLAGPLRSKGEWRDQTLRLDADIDIQGRLRGQPVVLQARTDGSGERWTLERFDLRLGDNRIDGQAALDRQLTGQLRIALSRLGQLWPGLQGGIDGQLDLAGTLQAPQGQLALQGQRLAYTDQRINNLALRATLDRAQRAQLDLTATGIALGDTALGTLTVEGQGDIKQQQLTLDLDGPLLQSVLAFDGTLDKGNWRGRLSRGELQSNGQDWRLQAPASLVRLASGQLTLGAHCWRSGPASLCGEDQRLMPEPRIRYTLANFPLDSLGQWLPKDFAWQGQLNAEIHLDLPASGPNGHVLLDAGQGVWRVREQDQWVDFPYDSLRLSSQLRPRQVEANLDLRGPEIGELALQAQLDPRPANKPLSGSFRLDGLDLAVMRPFVPMVERIAGQLNGSGSLSGSLLAPQVNGRLQLSDGELSGGELPTQFEALQLQALIAGESLQLTGGWRSGENGQGNIQGELAWGQDVSADIRVSGQRLPVIVEPYADLQVEPDLRVRLIDQLLSVSGKVAVPRGSILVRELPPSTVKVSEDAVIVGAQSKEKTETAIAMDIDVTVGQDKLTFSGFGLNADLAGQIHIGNDLETRGELALNNGRFRAYGQRLEIRRARLLFTGPIDQPFLDIEAIRRVEDVVAGLRLSGSADQPRSEVFSEPAMSQEQALSYLVLGRPMSSGNDNNMLARAALSLGLAGSSTMTGNVAQTLGIENFQLDTEGSGDGTSVVASGNLSERLSLRYGVGVFEPVNTVALRYELTKRLYLEAASGLASSLDLFYKRDF
ncbi:translocation/assembly module TamB [Pseudomonas sp. GD03944]|uniref:translocation/assembly module TamB domain-containing protein n=1 Tax=Pseudomonas sp. GD03944 TaxID=2975409 RepID=UPI00244A1E31|nr:translocation/assembly module TamB [Pseudomonas sp. GD03944]MDH1263734.1 translocation/assembly module TamB [Pseudomonas sp. GD03944]